MRISLRDFCSIVIAVVAGVVFSAHCFPQGEQQPRSNQNESLKIFLRDYLANSRSDDREPTRYTSAFVDLKDDGSKEVVVYVTGDFWCGSGGCMTLILEHKGSSFKVVSKMMTTLLPIRALTTKSNGWHDISVMARVWYGEGNVYSREQKLSFNGKSYRTSTQRSVEKLAGEVVIPATEEGTPLY
jgi:hypothetical protein